MSRPSTEPAAERKGARKPLSSMHRSLQKAFWTFGGVLVLVYAFVHSRISIWQEDQLLIQQTHLEFESYLQRHPEVLSGHAPPAMTSRFFSIHLGEASLPWDLQARALDLPPGIHEIHRSPTEGEDYVLGIRETTRKDQRLYLVYDVRRFDETGWWHSEIPVLFLACAVVFAIGLIWASRYSQKVLEPLTRLAEAVAEEPRPVHLADTLSQRQDPIEVANLSRAIERSMRTINEFVLREREFTRNASHELRTPLTVIRGAVELLRYEPLSSPAKQRLQRIERSVQQMEELIETFLWLARRHPGPTDETIPMTPIVHHVVESHRHLLGGRPVDVEIETDPDLRLAVHKQILAVVLANLVKNAFYSTQEGFVKISGSERSIAVTDSGPGLGKISESDPESSTHGFGLTIVRELCERSGWRLELAERRPSGTVATIILQSQE